MCGEDLATALFSVGFVPGTVWITGNVDVVLGRVQLPQMWLWNVRAHCSTPAQHRGGGIFYFTVANKLQTMSGLLFRQWKWDAETHRGERRRTWTNPSTATEKGEERFPCRCWDSGADVTVVSSHRTDQCTGGVLKSFFSSHRNQQSMVCLPLQRCW